MSSANRFRHQSYSNAKPAAAYQLLHPKAAFEPQLGSFDERMTAVGEQLRAHHVGAIYLVHGTFAGTDPFGMIGDLEQLLPHAGRFLRDRQKRVVDRLAADTGNYTPAFAARFATALNASVTAKRATIDVRLFNWSSENNHRGRCDGAVRLLAELAGQTYQNQRVLLWGHSHAGNVFALISNLLAAGAADRARFFSAGRSLAYPLWDQIWHQLANGRLAGLAEQMDVVTFGTPVRYGWDSAGYRQLLNIINHRSGYGAEEYLCAFPPQLDDVLSANGGDYIQQIGIAGTDALTSPLSYRQWRAERRLGRLIARGMRRRQLLRHLTLGQRVPAEGETLLIEYPDCEAGLNQLLSGHGIYTRNEWLLFHAELTARHLYGQRL